MPALWRAASALLAASAIAGCGSAAPSATSDPVPAPTRDRPGGVAITVAHTPAGVALAGPDGRTLYVRATDHNGTSTCTTGPCRRAWAALVADPADLQIAPGITGTFGITIWRDGTHQVTHNGRPLYFYDKDRAPGDARGEGVGGVWCIARISKTPGCETTIPEATFFIPRPAQRAAENAEDY